MNTAMSITHSTEIQTGEKCVFEVDANTDLTHINFRFGSTVISCNQAYLGSNMGACEELRHILDIIRQDVEVG